MRGEGACGILRYHGLTLSSSKVSTQEAKWYTPLSRLVTRKPGPRPAYPIGYIASLDGSRGFLTIGVLLAHTDLSVFGGAMVFMDVFFTMSGFLITSVLLKAHEKHGKISLKTFYLRRILRLYPALTAMVIALLVLSFFFAANFKERAIEAFVTWTYLMNYWWSIGGTPTPYTAHTWSLAVEEQFYLIWPVVLIVLLMISGVTRRTALIIFSMALAFYLWRCWLNYHNAPIQRLLITFDARADQLLIGCGLAILLKSVDLRLYPRLWRVCALSVLPITVAMAIILVTLKFQWTPGWYYYVSPFFGSLPAAVWVVGLLYPERTFMQRVYEHPAPVYVGRICYGLYIWHHPIFAGLLYYTEAEYLKWVLLVGWPVTFIVATMSYYFLERPFMRARPGV
jgi:peptidoglycan/LPS O-acetylase OafA/YrhL